jgi:hypothetical protein
MKSVCKLALAIALMGVCATAQTATCKGKFANPITTSAGPACFR